MKNPKRLSYNERIIVSSWGLNPENWRREKYAGGYFQLRNVLTDEIRIIPARVKERR